jgi:betaine-aldehyde dehydrogenase
MDGVRLGPVDDPDTDMGSLISVRQRDRVAAMVEAARQAGATIVRGGRIPDGPLGRAAYYEPTLITDAPQDSAIVQQEIFGPVLVCLPFDTDDEAIRLADDTPYGLAAEATDLSDDEGKLRQS